MVQILYYIFVFIVIKDKIYITRVVINFVIARGAINIKMYHWHASVYRK